MTREEKIICKVFLDDADKTHSCNEYKLLMALLEQEPAWIPIKTRPVTEEERQYYSDLGYDDEIPFMYDCPLPEDGEEVLITTRHDEVQTDIFCRDGCYFETYCDEDDVKAWMPFPKPYKAESEE